MLYSSNGLPNLFENGINPSERVDYIGDVIVRGGEATINEIIIL